MRDRYKEDKGAGDEQSGRAVYKARFHMSGAEQQNCGQHCLHLMGNCRFATLNSKDL
jgi:hypothetical protein